MRIAFIVPGYSATESAWAIPAIQAHIGFAAGRHDVEVFALRYPSSRGVYRIGRATVHALAGGVGLGARAAAFWARAVRMIVGRHRQRPFDVVHAFWADEPGLIAVLSASVLRVPAVVSFQGGELVGFEDLQYGLQLLRGRPTLIRFVARRAAMLTACSGYLRKLAQQWLPQRLAGKVGYATLGVDLERFHTMPATTAVRDDWTRVLSVGSLYPVKQHALAIDVIARVPRTRLTIVGRGPLEDALRAHAQRLGVDERVSLAGARDHVDMPSVYRSADVFLHTSRHEAHCTAVLEAAASHVPVVGTPVGVIPDVGVAAVGVDALADAVERLARRPEARQELAARAFERTRHEYSLVAAAAQHEGIYARVRART